MREERKPQEKVFDPESWKPKTQLGKDVKAGKIKHIDEILDKGLRILEPEIVDMLLPNLESELLMVGQAKGKFGGGQRRTFRQTQKKTAEGNKPSFSTLIVVGNKNGYIGLGYGKAKETVPAREKALRNAKLNLIRVPRGCGSWESFGKHANSIPFGVSGKCGSVKIQLMTAPRGSGLVMASECRKMLQMAGVEDVWSRTIGSTRTTMNLVYACFSALQKLSSAHVKPEHVEELNIVRGVQ